MHSIVLIAALAAASAGTIEGHWKNPSGSVTVSIGTCATGMCGTVIHASDKAKADARKGGTEELVGTVLLSHLVPDKRGQWQGQIFVPDMNVRSKAKLRPVGTNTLKVSGCGPGGMVCKSQNWTRAAP